jgi:hypothetical protein
MTSSYSKYNNNPTNNLKIKINLNNNSSSINSKKYYPISPKTLLKFEKKILSKLHIKYNSSDQTYNINVINNIIYNEKSHIVATFKDYLIIDDYSEFLKRYYKYIESMIRLPKFYEYYETYSKIYPNYTVIFEGKFIYKNIQRKQRMIDLQEQMEINNKNKNNKNNDNNCNNNNNKINVIINDFNDNNNNNKNNNNNNNNKNNVFDTDVINSILNVTNKEDLELLFNINRDNIEKDEIIFNRKILDIIDIIEKYENQNNNDHSNINIEKICKSPNNNNNNNYNNYNNYNNNNNNYNNNNFNEYDSNFYNDLNDSFDNSNIIEVNLDNSYNANLNEYLLDNNNEMKDKFKHLKKFPFKNWKYYKTRKDENCSICLEKFSANEKVKQFSCLEHIFHENCLENWLIEYNNNFCPLCKKEL